jgi:hypothetical protein
MDQIKELLKSIIPRDFGEIGSIAGELASVYDNNDGNQNHTISEALLALINHITNGNLFDYLNQEPSEYPILNTLQQVAKYHFNQARDDINRDIAEMKNNKTDQIFDRSININAYLMNTPNIFVRCIINHIKYICTKIEDISQSQSHENENAHTFDKMIKLSVRIIVGKKMFQEKLDILALLYNLLKSLITSHKDVLQSVREVDIQIAIIWAPIFTKSINKKTYDEITNDCVSMTYMDYILKIMDTRDVKIVNYMMKEDTDQFTSTDIRINPDKGIDIAEELSETLAGGRIKLLFYTLHSLYISILRVCFNLMMVLKLLSVVGANISMTLKGDISNFDSNNIDSWVSASIPINALIDSYIMDAPGPLKSAYNTDEKSRTETKIWASGVVFSIAQLYLKNQDYITSLRNIVSNCLTLKGSLHSISILWNINKILTLKNKIDFRITDVKRPVDEQPPEKFDGEIQSIPVVFGKHVVRKTQNPIGNKIKKWILDNSHISNVLLSLRRELLSMSIGLFIDNFLTFSGYDYSSKVKKLVYLVLKSGLTIYIKSSAKHHDTGGNKYIKYYDPNKYITDFILKLESTSYIKQDIRNANEMFLEGVFAKIVDPTSKTKVGMLIDIAFLVDSIIPAYLKFILTATSSLVAYNITSIGVSKVLPVIASTYSFFVEGDEFTDEDKAYYSTILSYVSLGVSLSIGAVSIGRSIKNWWRKGKQTGGYRGYGGYGDMVLYNGKLFEISNSVNEIRSVMRGLEVSNFNTSNKELTIVDKKSGEKLVLPLPPNNVNKEDIDENILFATLVNNGMPWDLTTFLLDDINENGQYNVETMRRFVKKLHEYITKKKLQNNSNLHPEIEEIHSDGAMFNFIIDPKTGNKYSVKSNEGRDILKHYANLIKSTRIIDPSTMQSIPLFGEKGNNIFMKYMKTI